MGMIRSGRKGAVLASVVAATAVLAAVAAGPAAGQRAPEIRPDRTDPGDMVMARQLLMSAIEAAMVPIDGVVLGADAPLPGLADRAYTISTLMSAFPHLFAPGTGPDAPNEDWNAPTSARASVWATFPDFYGRAKEAADVALAMSQATDLAGFRRDGTTLRAACNACHDAYLGGP